MEGIILGIAYVISSITIGKWWYNSIKEKRFKGIITSKESTEELHTMVNIIAGVGFVGAVIWTYAR